MKRRVLMWVFCDWEYQYGLFAPHIKIILLENMLVSKAELSEEINLEIHNLKHH